MYADNSIYLLLTLLFYNLLLYRKATINFGLTMRYDDPLISCTGLDSANEGILLYVTVHEVTHYIHFYYSRSTTSTNEDDSPKVEFHGNSTVTLTYSGSRGVVTVPGTLNQSRGLLDFSEDITQFMNSNVRISWEQNAYNTRGLLCDAWSLDNVAVKQYVGECESTIFSQNFMDRRYV